MSTEKDVVVIQGGRVIDPASGVDGIRTVVLREGKVAAVAERADAPTGARVVDARG
jgi:dihydroorotase